MRRPTGTVKALVAGILVVISVSATCWLVLRSGQPSKDGNLETKNGRLISEVSPATSRVAVAESPAVLSPEEEKTAKEKAERVAVIRRQQARLAELNKKRRPPAPYAIFEHSVENRIAGYLTMEPGTPIIVPPRFSARFVKDFEESCKQPIIIKDDDSDYVKQLKQQMIDTKIDLCNRMAKGESLVDILTETHRELQKLGEVKADIIRMTREEVRNNATSAEDVDIMIASANKLLEAKGIAPVKDNPVLRRNLMRLAEKNLNGIKKQK